MRWLKMGGWASLGQSGTCEDWDRRKGKRERVLYGGGDGGGLGLPRDLAVWEGDSSSS